MQSQCPLPNSGSAEVEGPFHPDRRCLHKGGLVIAAPMKCWVGRQVWDGGICAFTWLHFGASESGESLRSPTRCYSSVFSRHRRLPRHHPQRGWPTGSPRWRRAPAIPLPSHHRLPAGCCFYWKVSCFGSGRDMKASHEAAPGAAPCRAKAALPAAAIAFLSAPPSCRRCHRHRPRSAAGCRSGRRRSRSRHDGEGGRALRPQKLFSSRL